uniref:Uncharacterized protein n=1 Tax=Physcomitrium patens TaxID=3218 RepID=A0A2K1KJC0_PHYPA|nr:hypothetical protein PHYPA_007551 [Physcomitrium patens]
MGRSGLGTQLKLGLRNLPEGAKAGLDVRRTQHCSTHAEEEGRQSDKCLPEKSSSGRASHHRILLMKMKAHEVTFLPRRLIHADDDHQAPSLTSGRPNQMNDQANERPRISRRPHSRRRQDLQPWVPVPRRGGQKVDIKFPRPASIINDQHSRKKTTKTTHSQDTLRSSQPSCKYPQRSWTAASTSHTDPDPVYTISHGERAGSVALIMQLGPPPGLCDLVKTEMRRRASGKSIAVDTQSLAAFIHASREHTSKLRSCEK